MLLNTTEKCGKRLRNAEKRLITWKWCDTWQNISVLQRQRRFQISRVKNIGSFQIKRHAFRLVPPYGGVLVLIFCFTGYSFCHEARAHLNGDQAYQRTPLQGQLTTNFNLLNTSTLREYQFHK